MNRYRILPEHSTLSAEARSSLHGIRAETAGLEGLIEVEDESAAGNPLAGHVVLNSGLIKTGNLLYDRELERRLEIRTYPHIRGDAVESRRVGAGHFHLRGRLAFHGVSRELEGDVWLRTLGGDTIEIEGATVIDVRNFNLKPPGFLMLRLYPDVRVHLRITARLQARPDAA